LGDRQIARRPHSQFRCTVRSDTPRMAAISAKENPQKKLQVDDLGQRRVHLGQFVERLTDCESSRWSTDLSLASVPNEVISISPPRFWAWWLRA